MATPNLYGAGTTFQPNYAPAPAATPGSAPLNPTSNSTGVTSPPRPAPPAAAPPPAPSYKPSPISYVGSSGVPSLPPGSPAGGMVGRAQPMTQYKGQWMSPAEAEAAQARDAQAVRQQQQQEEADAIARQNASAVQANNQGVDAQRMYGSGYTVDSNGRLSFASQGTGDVNARRGSGSASGTGNSDLTPIPLSTLESHLTPPPAPVNFTPTAVPARHITNNSMADAAGYARAKDRVGMETRASMNALRGAMAERGIQGSGIEGQGMANIVGQGQGELGDFNRESAIQDYAAANARDEGDFQAALSVAQQNGQGVNATADANANRQMASSQSRIPSLQALAALRQSGVVY